MLKVCIGVFVSVVLLLEINSLQACHHPRGPGCDDRRTNDTVTLRAHHRHSFSPPLLLTISAEKNFKKRSRCARGGEVRPTMSEAQPHRHKCNGDDPAKKNLSK